MLLILAILILLAIGGGLISLLLRLIRKPIKWAFKLLIHAISGLIFLLAFNWLGSWIGLTLAINWFNAVFAGILGIPGVIVLVILTYLI